MTPLAFVLSLPIRVYQIVLSPMFGHHCRYVPSCSAYAIEALHTHGGCRGSVLIIRRLLRCHPFVHKDSCFDPVPPRTPSRPPRT